MLTLPGTLSALLGVSGLPDYPAAASADNPGTPVEDVQILPDADLGAGKLHAEAADDGASAYAHVGHQVDTIGLLPAFSDRHDPHDGADHAASTATPSRRSPRPRSTTSTSSAGCVSIDNITSEVTASIANDKPKATTSKVVGHGGDASPGPRWASPTRASSASARPPRWPR